MEPSKTPGCKEECSSSASGWTMYLGSPDNEYDNYNDDDDYCNTYEQERTCQRDNRRNHDADADGANNKSDDSMASDASSGPCHQELPQSSSKLSPDKDATSKYSRIRNIRKRKTKRDESRIKVEREEQPVLIAKDATSHAHSGAKVRKSGQMAK